jgi:hypothetical protein
MADINLTDAVATIGFPIAVTIFLLYRSYTIDLQNVRLMTEIIDLIKIVIKSQDKEEAHSQLLENRFYDSVNEKKN